MMCDTACTVIVYVLYFMSPEYDYMYHAGEYADRDKCNRAAELIREATHARLGHDKAVLHHGCWAIRKVMEE